MREREREKAKGFGEVEGERRGEESCFRCLLHQHLPENDGAEGVGVNL